MYSSGVYRSNFQIYLIYLSLIGTLSSVWAISLGWFTSSGTSVPGCFILNVCAMIESMECLTTTLEETFESYMKCMDVLIKKWTSLIKKFTFLSVVTVLTKVSLDKRSCTTLATKFWTREFLCPVF